MAGKKTKAKMPPVPKELIEYIELRKSLEKEDLEVVDSISRLGAKTEQEFRNEFHMLMGYCIAEWATLEDALFKIFYGATLTGIEQAAIIYYKTPTLETRLTLVSEVVISALPRPNPKNGAHPHASVKEWRNVESSVRELLHTRARIAHHPVWKKSIPILGSSTEYGFSWYESASSEIEKLRGRHEQDKPLTVHDLCVHWMKIKRTARSLHSFYILRLLMQIAARPLPSAQDHDG